MSVSIVVKNACEEVGDSPHWEAASQTLIYVDAWKGTVHRWDPTKAEDDVFLSVGKPVTFALPCKTPDRFLISHGRRLGYVDAPKRTGKTVFGDREPHKATPVMIGEVEEGTNHTFSTGKCDVRGRLWTGTMGGEEGLLDHLDSVARDMSPLETSEADSSALYRVQPPTATLTGDNHVDSAVIEPVHKPVCISNGIAWNLDNTKMFFVDSCARKVTCFDYDAKNGSIYNPTDVIVFGKGTFQQWGFPAGICMDTAGKLWVACYNAAKVARFDVETGNELSNVVIPGAKRITSCCFGGKNYDEMYVTSSRRHVTELEFMTDQSNAGSLFKITGLGVRGTAQHEADL